jgi:hypothetical protein
VVGVSEVAEASEAEAVDDPICEYCGRPIEESGQQCDALADGRCRA